MNTLEPLDGQEIAQLTNEKAREYGFTVCSILSHAMRDLWDADDTNRAARYDHYVQMDQLAMECSFALADHPVVAKVIRDVRAAMTMACTGLSPYAIALERPKGRAKTYIARNPETGLLKIGRSVDPARRMEALKTGAGVLPEMLLVVDRDIEGELHKQFARLRAYGEWFKDDGSIAEFISGAISQEKS